MVPPIGAQRAGEVGPNSAMSGTPSPAAKCIGPVSPEIKTWARFNTARNKDKSSAGSTGASGTRVFNSDASICSRGL